MKDEVWSPQPGTKLHWLCVACSVGTEAQYLVHMSRRGKFKRQGWDYLADLQG